MSVGLELAPDVAMERAMERQEMVNRRVMINSIGVEVFARLVGPADDSKQLRYHAKQALRAGIIFTEEVSKFDYREDEL